MTKTLTQHLLLQVKDIWEKYYQHPFITGLADGTLDVAKFRFYMIQDYLYLREYSKVFAIGIAKAKEIETMRVFTNVIHQIFEQEMSIHRHYLQRLGIQPETLQNEQPSLDNVSYTSYLLRIAYEEGPAEIIAAILSCALSYEEIAKKILIQNPEAATHTLYGEWIRGYASAEYHSLNQHLILLFEKCTIHASSEQIRYFETIFLNCSHYEYAFWEMAWSQPCDPPLLK